MIGPPAEGCRRSSRSASRPPAVGAKCRDELPRHRHTKLDDACERALVDRRVVENAIRSLPRCGPATTHRMSRCSASNFRRAPPPARSGNSSTDTSVRNPERSHVDTEHREFSGAPMGHGEQRSVAAEGDQQVGAQPRSALETQGPRSLSLSAVPKSRQIS